MFDWSCLLCCLFSWVSWVANYCTPEINNSEIIVDVQWHFPINCQRCFPMDFHFSVVCSKGLSLPQWMFTGIVQWVFSGTFQWKSLLRSLVCNIPPRLAWCIRCPIDTASRSRRAHLLRNRLDVGQILFTIHLLSKRPGRGAWDFINGGVY